MSPHAQAARRHQLLRHASAAARRRAARCAGTAAAARTGAITVMSSASTQRRRPAEVRPAVREGALRRRSAAPPRAGPARRRSPSPWRGRRASRGPTAPTAQPPPTARWPTTAKGSSHASCTAPSSSTSSAARTGAGPGRASSTAPATSAAATITTTRHGAGVPAAAPLRPAVGARLVLPEVDHPRSLRTPSAPGSSPTGDAGGSRAAPRRAWRRASTRRRRGRVPPRAPSGRRRRRRRRAPRCRPAARRAGPGRSAVRIAIAISSRSAAFAPTSAAARIATAWWPAPSAPSSGSTDSGQAGRALGRHDGAAGGGPAAERHRDRAAVHLRVGHPVDQRAHEVEPLRVEPDGLARERLRHRGGQGADRAGRPVDALEQHRADRDRAAVDDPQAPGRRARTGGRCRASPRRRRAARATSSSSASRRSRARPNFSGSRPWHSGHASASSVGEMRRAWMSCPRSCAPSTARRPITGAKPVNERRVWATSDSIRSKIPSNTRSSKSKPPAPSATPTTSGTSTALRSAVSSDVGVGRVVASDAEHGRIVRQRAHGGRVVGQADQTLEARLDVGAVQRAVLVQGRAAVAAAGVERERHLERRWRRRRRARAARPARSARRRAAPRAGGRWGSRRAWPALRRGGRGSCSGCQAPKGHRPAADRSC